MVGKKGMKAYERTPEIRQRMRLAKLGKKLSAEHKAKISLSLLGNQYRKGIPTPMEMRLHLQSTSRKQTLEERFWSNVKKTDGCWLWKGSCFKNGYGKITIRNRIEGTKREILVHRFAYELLVGPIPDGKLVCHTCDIHPCVRPDHLFPGTPLDNSKDCVQKGRQAHPDHHGILNHMAKLTEEQVRDIRRLSQDGISKAQLARDFGMSESGIIKIIKKRSWKHIL